MILATQPDMNLVAQASNGHEAIVESRTHRPDITLMDLQMPKMDGVDAMMCSITFQACSTRLRIS
jgi:YesN/AraC family two-component response regulator